MSGVGLKAGDLKFITDDLRNQIAHSRSLLDNASQLRSLADQVQDQTLKEQLLQNVANLVELAGKMAANVSSTSTTATTTVSSAALGGPRLLEMLYPTMKK